MGKMLIAMVLAGACGCMGSPLPIDSVPDGGSAAPIQCRLDLQEPFVTSVSSPDAHCMKTDLGTTVEWGRPDAPWSVSVSLIADPGLTWQGNPCEMSEVDFKGDEIDFRGMLYGAPVRGSIYF